jgi:hypothetical protein
VGVDGGAPLIPEDHLQPCLLPQQLPEGSALFGAGALGAVHVPGIAQHQQFHVMLGDELPDAGEYLLLLAAVEHVGVPRQRLGIV